MTISSRAFMVVLAVVALSVGWFTVARMRFSEVILVSAGEQARTVRPPDDPSASLTDTGVPARKKGSGPVLVLLGGDMMFDRYIRTVARTKGNDFILAGLEEVLREADIVVANLEGPITNSASRSESSVMGEAANYVFTFDPSWATTLRARGIGVVNIGNNHILNFGAQGLEETRGFLDSAGVAFFGDPLDPARRFLIREVGSVSVGLVNYNQFVADGGAKALEDIRSVRGQADTVVVYTHWGTEYVGATADEKRLGHAFIDAGADAVIGSHPHVVQETETYQGRRIYYSLGNLIFDQYFRDDTRHGLLVEMAIDPASHGLSFRDIPVELERNGRTAVAREGL